MTEEKRMKKKGDDEVENEGMSQMWMIGRCGEGDEGEEKKEEGKKRGDAREREEKFRLWRREKIEMEEELRK